MYRGATSDDRGEYKITVREPGEFYLRCAPTNFSMGPAMRGTGLRNDEMLVPQYYGGAMESKDAVPLKLRGGEILTGMDFHLIPQHAAAISGRVTGVPPSEPPTSVGDFTVRRGFRGGGQSVSIEIFPAGEDNMFWNEGSGAAPPDYHFEFPGLPPGRYRVQATIRTKDKTYYAEQTVDAHEGSTEVALVLSPPVEVKGHLRIEGRVAHAEDLTVQLQPLGRGHSGQAYSAKVAKDGSFVMQDVAPAEFFLQINPDPEGAFEKSVLLGDKSFLYKRIEIPPGSDAPLNIVISTNRATIEGEVDAGAATGKRAGILIAPVGERHNLTRFYSYAIAEDTGKFKVNGIAPGKYKIFALEKTVPGSFVNPESADLLDNLGEELTVPEGAKVQSHPKLIPLETVRDLLKP